MKEDSIFQSKLASPHQIKNLDVVYHYTFEGSVDKIIEFGFDIHLRGQGSRRRLRDSNPSRINDDFVEFLETRSVNRVINTCVDPEKSWAGDYLLRIRLKPDAKLLDADSVDELANTTWSKKLSYARQRGYDGVQNGDGVFLFSNKKIECIERVPGIQKIKSL